MEPFSRQAQCGALRDGRRQRWRHHQVQFFADDTLLGEDSEAPFEFDWTPSTAADVVLTAVATGDREGQSTSDAVSVTVLPPNVGPEVVITHPLQAKA